MSGAPDLSAPTSPRMSWLQICCQCRRAEGDTEKATTILPKQGGDPGSDVRQPTPSPRRPMNRAQCCSLHPRTPQRRAGGGGMPSRWAVSCAGSAVARREPRCGWPARYGLVVARCRPCSFCCLPAVILLEVNYFLKDFLGQLVCLAMPICIQWLQPLTFQYFK
jgi:hypothetical protein